MSIEAMKQWLEALETPWMSYTEDGCDIALGKRMKAINALRQAIEQAEKQAPLAWPLDNQHAERIAERHCVSYEVVQLIAREILTTPQLQQAEKQEPVAWRETHGKVIRALAEIVTVHTPDNLFDLDAIPRDPVMGLVQKIKMAIDGYKPPTPQREWVSLTDEEIKKFWRDTTVKPCYTSELIDTFAKAIEAKLKEKNS